MLIAIKTLPRYALLRGLMPVGVGRVSYLDWVGIGLFASLFFLTSPLFSVCMVWLTLAIYLLETFVVIRHYIRETGQGISLVVGNAFVVALWAFVGACAFDWIPNGMANVHFKLWGVIDCIYNLAFVSAVNAKFARKFSRADELTLALEAANIGLEARIREKTEELNASFARVMDMQKSKEDFMTSMIHNIKTPLFTAGGYLDMAEAALSDASVEAAQYLRNANDNIDYVRRITDDLLLLTRLGDNKIEFDRVVIHLDEFVQAVISSAAIPAATKSIRLHYAPQMRGMVCVSDAHYLRQAIENIVDNAIRHSPEGGVIYVETARDPDKMRICIRDEGEGIPAADIPRVFDRYFTRASDRKGAGLGLTIAKEIIGQLGGQVTVNSQPNRGCQFTVSLPITCAR